MKKALKSSNVRSASYDSDEKTLTVNFKNGRSYEYSVENKSLFTRLTNVQSPGKFVHRNLKPKGGNRVK